MSQVYNILVENIDAEVTVEALTTFFSFTGNVIEVRLSDCDDGTKSAIVTFDNEESVKTAELMTGATLGGRRITIQSTTLTHQTNEQIFTGETLPQRTIPELPEQHTKTSVAASLLAQGYILASDTFQKAVQFDREHSITSTIKAGATKVKEKVIEVDEKLHFTEYLALGASYVNSVITGIDDKYQISNTVSSALGTASEKIDSTLHISEGVQTVKSAINSGVDKVKNSQPVQSIKSTTQNFKNDIKQEITTRRPDMVKEENPVVVEEVVEPFEVNSDHEDLLTSNVVQIEPQPDSELSVPPPVTDDLIIVEGDITEQLPPN